MLRNKKFSVSKVASINTQTLKKIVKLTATSSFVVLHHLFVLHHISIWERYFYFTYYSFPIIIFTRKQLFFNHYVQQYLWRRNTDVISRRYQSKNLRWIFSSIRFRWNDAVKYKYHDQISINLLISMKSH